MNILTGVVFCVLAISYICVQGSSKYSEERDIFEGVCAVSLLCMICLVGYWMAVLLGKV